MAIEGFADLKGGARLQPRPVPRACRRGQEGPRRPRARPGPDRCRHGRPRRLDVRDRPTPAPATRAATRRSAPTRTARPTGGRTARWSSRSSRRRQRRGRGRPMSVDLGAVDQLGSDDFNERAKALAALCGTGPRRAHRCLVKALTPTTTSPRPGRPSACPRSPIPRPLAPLDAAAARRGNPNVRAHAAAGSPGSATRVPSTRCPDDRRSAGPAALSVHGGRLRPRSARPAGRPRRPPAAGLRGPQHAKPRARGPAVGGPGVRGWDAAQWTEWVNRPHP